MSLINFVKRIFAPRRPIRERPGLLIPLPKPVTNKRYRFGMGEGKCKKARCRRRSRQIGFKSMRGK